MYCTTIFLIILTAYQRFLFRNHSINNFRLLKNACKLKLLDLRGCTHLTSTGLQTLAATDLQSLFISQSSIAKYEGIEIIMQKVSPDDRSI